MSAVQNSTNLNLAGSSPEFNKPDAIKNTQDKKVGVDSIVQTVITNEPGNSANQQPLTAEQLEKVAQQLQDFVGEMNRGLEFSVDQDSGRDVIKVIDKNSGDLVKQFPSEEVLTLVAKLSDMVGGFIDAKV